MKLFKKGALGAIPLILLLVIGVVAVWYFMGDGGGTTASAFGTSPAAVRDCPGDVSPQITFTAVNEFTNAAVSASVQYKVNGNLQTIGSTGTAISVSPGDKVEYMINATGYYSNHGFVDIGCKETELKTVSICQHSTSPTFQLYCQDDSLLNSATNTEGLPANAVDTQTIKFRAESDKCVQDPVFFLDYIGTNIDDVDSNLPSVSVPKHTALDTAFGSAFNKQAAFQGSTVKDGAASEWFLDIDVGSSAYGTGNMSLRYDDSDWYLGKDGQFKYGTSNDDGNDIASYNQTTLVYTASS